MRIELFVKSQDPRCSPFLGFIFNDGSPDFLNACSAEFWQAGAVVGARLLNDDGWKVVERADLEAFMNPLAGIPKPAALLAWKPAPGSVVPEEVPQTVVNEAVKKALAEQALAYKTESAELRAEMAAILASIKGGAAPAPAVEEKKEEGK